MIDGREISQLIEHISRRGQPVIVGKRLVEIDSGNRCVVRAASPSRISASPWYIVGCPFTLGLLDIIVERQRRSVGREDGIGLADSKCQVAWILGAAVNVGVGLVGRIRGAPCRAGTSHEIGAAGEHVS